MLSRQTVTRLVGNALYSGLVIGTALLVVLLLRDRLRPRYVAPGSGFLTGSGDSQARQQIESLTTTIDSLGLRLDQVEIGLEVIAGVPKDASALVAIGQLDARTSDHFETMGKRIDTLERLLSDTPERALAIERLRQDIESTKKVVAAEQAATRNAVDQLYAQNNVILGIMGAILVAFLVRPLISLGSSIRGRSPGNENPTELKE